MKKRILSAFIALSMLFSLFPTAFATQSFDGNGTFSGTPNVLSNLNIEISEGSLKTLSYTAGSDQSNDGNRMYVVLLTDYYNEDLGFNDKETLEDAFSAYVKMENNDSTYEDSFGYPAYRWVVSSAKIGDNITLDVANPSNSRGYDWSTGDTGFGSQEDITYPSSAKIALYVLCSGLDCTIQNAFIYEFSLDENRSYKYPATTGDTEITEVSAAITAPVGGGTPATQATNISANPSAGVTATTADLTWTGNQSTFDYDTDYTASFTLTPESGYKFTTDTTVTIDGAKSASVTSVDDTTGNATVTATFHTAAQQTQTISSVAAMVTAPAVKTAISTTATVSGTGVSGTSATAAWSPETNVNGNFAAGVEYTVSVPVTAESGYQFDSSTTVTVNGETATLTVDDSDSTKATITYKFSAITKTVDSISATGTLADFTDGSTFTAPTDTSATLTYNDGSTATFQTADITSDNNFSYAYGTDKADLTTSTTLTASDNSKPVYVKYSGSNITGSNTALYYQIGTLTVGYAPIESAALTIATPAPAGTPASATVPENVHYTAATTWYTGDSTSGTAFTGNFQYGTTYTAKIVATADSDNGYTFSSSATATLNDENITPTISEEKDTVTITKSYTIEDAPKITDIGTYDEYESTDNTTVTITLDKAAVDVTKLTINSKEISASNYTLSDDKKTITVKKAGITEALNGGTLTADGVSWNVEVATSAGDVNANSQTLTAKDTTPYITITDPSNGTITGITHTSGTKVALTKNTSYTLTAPSVAHTTAYTWTVTGATDTDSADNTFTFTPTGGENITATVELTVDSGHKLTISKNDGGSVTVTKSGDSSAMTANTDGTYTVYSDESYTVTATANDQYKVTALADETISGVQKTVSHTVSNPSTDTTVTATFAAKTAPTVNPDSTQTFSKSSTSGDITYTYDLGDYSSVSVSGVTCTQDTTNKTYTVAYNTLTGLANGDHTLTFDFGEGMTITRTITVKAALSITSVTAPTGTFVHGDTFSLDGFAFTVTEDGTATSYTYTSTYGWNSTIPSDAKFSLDGTNYSSWDTFKTTVEAMTTRHDTTNTTTVNNGAKVYVSIGSATGSSSAINVDRKAITIAPSTTSEIDKVYDGTSAVTATITAADFSNSLVSGDSVSVSLSGKYYSGLTTEVSDANLTNTPYSIQFTAAATGNDADNYNITVSNGSGTINTRELTLVSVPNIPSAKNGVAKTGTVDSEALTSTNLASGSNAIVNGDTVNVSYTYTYDATSSTNVKIENITSKNSNYTVTPTSFDALTGTREERTVKSVTVTPSTTTYNYSDTLSTVTITVAYDDSEGDTTYNSIADAKAGGVSVYWGDTTTDTVTDSQVLTVSNTKITAAYSGKTGTADITVNPLKVNVTVAGTITKTYDGSTTLDADDTLTYSVAADDTNYSTKLTADNITASSSLTSPVTYNSSTVKDATGVTVSSSNLTLSDSVNYEINNVINNANASITAKEITVTAITVPSVKQYSTDTDIEATNQKSTAVTFSGVIGSETPSVDYKYTYTDTSTAGEKKSTDSPAGLSIKDLALTSTDTNSVNANYTLGSSTPTLTGTVEAQTAQSLTVTAPTQFTDATADTYGDTLDLAGLVVAVKYSDTYTETYTWTSTGWTKSVTSGTGSTTVTSVPFTLSWGDSTNVPAQGETLTVTQHNGKGITATHTNGSTKGTSSAITVNPITLSGITITGSDISKVYDGTTTADSTGFTYAITSGVLSGDTVTVTPGTVEYSSKDVHTSQALTFSGWTLGGTNASNYAIADSVTLTGTPNGTITQRPLQVTAVSAIPSIDQYTTTLSGTVSSDTNATFGAVTGNSNSGLVTGDTQPTLSYDYAYTSSTTAGSADVNVSNIAITGTSSNYSLNNTTLTTTGTVNAVTASSIEIVDSTKPSQMQSNADVQYGDTLDYTGLVIKVGYGASASTATKYFKWSGSAWVECTENDGTYTDATNGVSAPFTATWTDGSSNTVAQGDALSVGTATFTASLTNDNTKTATGTITVSKRKVTVSAALVAASLTKMYDGTTDAESSNFTWTVTKVKSDNYTLPISLTVSSATYAYDTDTVNATKVTVSNPALSDADNFEITSYTAQEFTGSITKRTIKLEAITNIPQVKRYATTGISGTGATATSASGATFATTSGTYTDSNNTSTNYYAIASGDTVSITYDWKYQDTTESNPSTENVNLSNIALASSDPSMNYDLIDATVTSAVMPPIADNRTITKVEVTKPTQFNSTVYYNNTLDLTGMTVKLTYSDNESDTYTASVDGNSNVVWSNSETTVDSGLIPFTLSWQKETSNTAPTQGEILTVTQHNGNAIVATVTDGTNSYSGSETINVSPKEITNINAQASDTITKVYDGDATVDTAITYSSNDVLTGDTVTITATAAYDNKNVGTNKVVSFSNFSVSGNDNYTIGSSASANTLNSGVITAKPVTITGVYVPATYVDNSASSAEAHSITNATVGNSTSAANTVTIDSTNGFVGSEASDMKFNYTISYAATDLTSAGTPTVTLSNNTVEGSTENPSTNYNFTWPASLTGNVLADKYTSGCSITAPSKLTDYTHGDTFDPTELSVKLTTDSNTTGTTYTVTKDGSSYKWDTALPTGVSVSVGNISLTSDSDLNRNIDYSDMNGKAFILTAGDQTKTTDSTLTVAKADLTVTANATSWDKIYDGDDLVDGVTYTVNGLKTINGVADKVGVTATAKYASKDVSMSGSDVQVQTISFSDITTQAVDGVNNSADYNTPTMDTTYSGKINPFTLTITAINDNIPNATRNDSNTQSNTLTTTNYTYENSTTNPVPDSTLPTLSYKYTYSDISSIASGVTVTITDTSMSDTNYKMTYTGGDKTGNVVGKTISALTIKTQPKTSYKYGDTLNLSDMVVTVTYGDNATEDVTYGTDAWTNLGLTLEVTKSLPTDGTTVLKNSTNDQGTITVKAGNVSSDAVTITVSKRTLLISATIDGALTKTYDGTNTVSQTITLVVATDQTSYDGVLTGDTISVTQPTAFTYDSVNKGDTIQINYTGAALSGDNATEYDPSYPSLTGAITAREVTLTPSVTVVQNKYATENKTVTVTSKTLNELSSGSETLTASNLVDNDTNKDSYTYSFTVTVPADTLKNVTTSAVTLNADALSNNSVTGTNTDNYSFTWNAAQVNVTANEPISALITTDPTSGYSKTYGDTFDPTGMVVTVTYADGSTHDYTYSTDTGSEWVKDGLAVLVNGSAAPTGVLRTDGAYCDKYVTVTVPKSDGTTVTTENNDNKKLTVSQKSLTLTAAAADTIAGITKTYDSTTDAKSLLTFGVTSADLVSGDSFTVDTTNATATFNDKNVGTSKAITISGLTISGTNADQYTLTMPTGVMGSITAKAITVTVAEANVPSVLINSTGDDLKKEVTTFSYKDSIAPYSTDSVTVQVYADYTGKSVSTSGSVSDVPLSVSVTGDDKNNYTFTVEPTSITGSVADNIITNITISSPTNTTYTHGDSLNLSGTVITVSYQNSKDDNTFTYSSGDDWTATTAINGSTTVTTANLPVSIKLGSSSISSATQQLRHDTNDKQKLVIADKNSLYSGTAESTELTVNTKEITEVYITPPSTTPPIVSKTYDGTTSVPVDGFSYYSNQILDNDQNNVTLGSDLAYADANVAENITINATNPAIKSGTMISNYTMSANATINWGGVTNMGKITPAPLTVTINSVPSIYVGADKTVTLTENTDYTVTGMVNNESNPITKVTGTYSQNDSVATGVNVTYATEPSTLANYSITVSGSPTGTVNKLPVKSIAVTAPTTSSYSHGDKISLEGMTITVTYNDDTTKTYSYTNSAWNTTLEDLDITWDGTTTEVTDGSVIRLDDTDKGLAADGDNKKAAIKVTSTVPAADGTTYPSGSTDITLGKKVLGLEITGNLFKVYDATTTFTDSSNVLAFVISGVADSDTVSVNETAAKANITVPDANTYNAQALTFGTISLTGNNADYYTLPDTGITNNATGTIEKRKVKITGITKNMNAAVGADKTGTLLGTTEYSISNDDGYYSIVSGQALKINVDYEYGDTSKEGTTTVTYSRPTLSEDNETYKDMYEVEFAIEEGSATISNGDMTGISIKTGTTEYTHGDTFNLDGTEITVTYANGSSDTYKYDGGWKKNGADTVSALPSEIGIKLGDTSVNVNPTSDADKTVIKYNTDNTAPLLKAVVTGPGTDPDTTVTKLESTGVAVTLKKKPVTITVANNGTDAIAHTYSGSNALTADETSKLTVTVPTDFAVSGDTVSVTGTPSATIGADTKGNVKSGDLDIAVSGYTLEGTDKDCYEIVYDSTAKGTITPAAMMVTITSVPAMNEGDTNLTKTLTKDVNYTQTGTVGDDVVNLTVTGTYPDSTYTDGTADKTVTYAVTNAADYPNYTITLADNTPKGTVTKQTATVTIIGQPEFVSSEPKHGDKIGENGLDGFEYKVTYADGTETKHKRENGDWVTTDGYTAPEDGTVFTWANDNNPVSEDSEIRRGADYPNIVLISVPNAETVSTEMVEAAKKPITITASGLYTKEYDTTNTVTLDETNPEITYTIEGLATGDTVTVTATPAFADENVAMFGDAYQKAINFTNVTISDTDNYEIKQDENGNDISPIMGSITPKKINITAITVPKAKKNSTGSKTVTGSDDFTTADIYDRDKDFVTIGYTAEYSTSKTGTVGATVTDVAVDGKTDAEIDGKTVDESMNYIVDKADGATIEITSSGGGGGGGGGSSTSLSIKYKKEDGTAGNAVSSIKAEAGTDVDLIAVISSKLSDMTVTWTSDNEDVATVDENGVVTFVSEGKAVITAQSNYSSTLKDTVTVTVTKSTATPTPTPTEKPDSSSTPTPAPSKEPSVITKTMLNPYIVGYDNNVFGPELPISREEVSAIFARLIANNIYMDKSYDTSFSDVVDGWSKDYIGYLESFKVVSGYEDGTFRPQAYITRAEMAVMMAKAEGYDISGYMSSDEVDFPDVDEGYSGWAVKAIKYLTDNGIMEGYPDGTFGPNKPITRAETVATVNRVLADMTVENIEVLPSDMTDVHWAYDDVVFAMNHRILKDAAADESQFIESEEFDKNKVTTTETVEDTNDETSEAGASPTPEPNSATED